MSRGAVPLTDQGVLDGALTEAIELVVQHHGNGPLAAGGEEKQKLINLLYQFWYTRSEVEKKFDSFPHPFWDQVYRTMHHGTYQWETGWKVDKVSSAGRVIAILGDEVRLLDPGDYISLFRPGSLPAPGSEIKVVARRETAEQQPGFWITHSTAWGRVQPVIVRLYWNTSPEGGACLVKQITQRVPDNIPYSLKVPADGAGYQRADAAVFYFQGSFFNELRPVLHVIYSAMQTYLWPEVPGLTKECEPGLALAEDPPEEFESFGLHRCRLVAEGMLLATASDWHDLQTVGAVVKEYLVTAGLDPVRPYLNLHARTNYDW